MWPFSSNDKSSDDVTESISPNLQDFFEVQDRSAKGIKLQKPDEPEIFLMQAPTSLEGIELERFRQDSRRIAAINCAEIQEAALACFKGWKFLSGTECSTAMARVSKCMAIQQNTLNRLRYEKCSSKDECVEVRILADELFSRNFGSLGENITEENQEKFESDLERTQQFLWGPK